MPFHLGRSVGTGPTLGDLDQARDDVLRKLSEGAIAGLVAHLDEDGLRPLLGQVRGSVQRARRASVEAFAAGRPEPHRPDDDAPSLDETGAPSSRVHLWSVAHPMPLVDGRRAAWVRPLSWLGPPAVSRRADVPRIGSREAASTAVRRISPGTGPRGCKSLPRARVSARF
jgi:hypothetical protein